VSPEGRKGEVQSQAEVEVLPPPPSGVPQQFGPKNLQPLFDEAQLKKEEEVRKKAPML
jgi:hypothetical protein